MAKPRGSGDQRSDAAATTAAVPLRRAAIGEPGDGAGPPVHYERLAPRLAGAATPLVWLGGLPGTGRRALLAACRAGLGASAASLAPALADDLRSLRAEIAARRAAGARRFFVDEWPAVALARAIGWLQPHEALVASRGALPDDLDLETRARATSIGGRELLLTPAEVGELLARRGGERADAPRWHRWSDGWLAPLELALECAGAAAPPDAEADERRLAGSEALRSFLNDRVLSGLDKRDLAALRRIVAAGAGGGSESPQAARRRLGVTVAAWHELADRRQLVLLFGEGYRVPRPLALHLVEPRSGGASVAGVSAAPARVVVRLLGPPRVELVDEHGSVEELSWPFRRVLQLLALLALHPEGCPQERVLEALWPETGLAAARAGLHPTVSHLRRLLARSGAGNAVRLQAGFYRLDPQWSWSIDARRFDELASGGQESEEAGARLARLEEAWRLYRGPLLEGMSEPWTLEPRQRLEQKHRQVLAELSELYARHERLEEAEDCLRTLLAGDPLREDVHLRLMLLHARRGRTDLVRRQYERLCGLLARELGAQPLDATVRAVERLLG